MNMLVPHWPPLYPLFLKTILTACGYSDTALYTIVGVQHLIAASGAAYICYAVRGLGARLFLAFTVVVANYFNVFTHGIYTEAVSCGLLLWLLGAAIRLGTFSALELDRMIAQIIFEIPFCPTSTPKALTSRRLALAVTFTSLLLMTLTRYNMYIFAAVIPGIYLFQFCCEAKFRRQEFFASLGLCVLAFIVAQGANSAFGRIYSCDMASRFGRPAAYRLHELPWKTMSAQEREHLKGNMLRRCPDDFTKFALNTMIEDNNPWIGSHTMIDAWSSRFHTKKTADQAMNDAALAFFLTPNKYLLAEIGNTFNSYMGEHNSTFTSAENLSEVAVMLYRKSPDIDKHMRLFPILRRTQPEDYRVITRFLRPASFDGVCRYYWLGGLTLLIGFAGFLAKRLSTGYFSLLFTFSLSIVLYAGLSAAVTEFVPRYLIPVNELVWLSIAMLIIGLCKPTAKVDKSANHSVI